MYFESLKYIGAMRTVFYCNIQYFSNIFDVMGIVNKKLELLACISSMLSSVFNQELMSLINIRYTFVLPVLIS